MLPFDQCPAEYWRLKFFKEKYKVIQVLTIAINGARCQFSVNLAVLQVPVTVELQIIHKWWNSPFVTIM